MRNFIHDGKTIQYTVPMSTTLTVGDALLLGNVLCVVFSTNNNTATATTGEIVTLATYGVFTLPKDTSSGSGWSIGDLVYWTGTAVTGASSGNTLIGYAWDQDAADGDTTGIVKLQVG